MAHAQSVVHKERMFCLRPWLVCLVLTMCVHAASAQNEDAATIERRVKAAYLHKFISYVEWPDGAFARPDTPIVIAVMGDDRFADDLAQLVAGRNAEGRPLVVRKQRDDELTNDVRILFIARAEMGARLRAAGKLSRPVLIVTEAEGALNLGSAINFVTTGGRVRFEVSLEAAEKRGIRLSSRLLTVAQTVRGGS